MRQKGFLFLPFCLIHRFSFQGRKTDTYWYIDIAAEDKDKMDILFGLFGFIFFIRSKARFREIEEDRKRRGGEEEEMLRDVI